ncbi:hypothetical protein [Bradyrhizobium sp. ISRA442]
MSLNTTAVRIRVTIKDVKPEVMRCLVVGRSGTLIMPYRDGF